MLGSSVPQVRIPHDSQVSSESRIVMTIAVASGKGGTGKTTIATNLAAVFASRGCTTAYVDCDVEAPNGHIFLKPKIAQSWTSGVPTPKIDAEKCDGCGECGKICQFSAIVVIKGKVLTFPDLCHGCGGCSLVCPMHAIEEVEHEIGTVEVGLSGEIKYIAGRLRIGEAMSPPLIRAVKLEIPSDSIVLIDSPPGTSCPMIEAVRGADYVVLVTEPTPFGLNDLKLAVETVRELSRPFGVVINQCDIGDSQVEAYCRKEEIPILEQIPHDRSVAEDYSRGHLLVESSKDMRAYFNRLADKVLAANRESSTSKSASL